MHGVPERDPHRRPTPWLPVADLLARQHGVASRHQLRALGVSRDQIDGSARTARLRRVGPSVYAAAGASSSWEGRVMAAVLANGHGAVASHRTAARIWDLRPSVSPAIDVTVPRRTGRTRPGWTLHRRPTLGDDETTVHRGIPVVTPARALVDLAAVVGATELRRAVAQAEIVRRFDLDAVQLLLDRHPRHAGRRPLAAILEVWSEPPTIRSPLEAQFADVCRRHDLPDPHLNAIVDGTEVDAVFDAGRTAVELDDGRTHLGRLAFEEDRRRSAILTAKGWRTLRFTACQLAERDGAFVAEIVRATLAGGRPHREP